MEDRESLANMIRVDGTVLEEENTVWKLLNNVVFPAIFLRHEDEERFRTDYKSYMSEELDTQGKRRTACRLFRRVFITSYTSKQECTIFLRTIHSNPTRSTTDDTSCSMLIMNTSYLQNVETRQTALIMIM